MDRLTANAHKLELKGESMRKKIINLHIYTPYKGSGSLCPESMAQFAVEQVTQFARNIHTASSVLKKYG